MTLRGPARPAAVDETGARPTRRRAAFWLVAGAIHPDAELRLDGVSTNPTRRAIIDILRRMGAAIEETAIAGPGGPDGEPLADLVVRSSQLRGVDLSPAEVAAAIDEIPVLALAAAVASGTTRIRGAGELRHKESDRIAGIAAGPHRPRRATSGSRATTSRSTAAGVSRAPSPRPWTITGWR